jgi:hypothetical protein
MKIIISFFIVLLFSIFITTMSIGALSYLQDIPIEIFIEKILEKV